MTYKRPPVDHSIDFQLSWWFPLVFLKYAVWLVLLTSLGFLLLIYFFTPDQPQRAIGPLVELLASGACLFLIARGKIRAALYLLAWTTWATVTVVLYFYGGVRGTLVVVYPLLVMLGGWLLGERSALLFALLTVVATLGFVLTEHGHVLPALSTTPSAMYGLIQITCILISVFLIVFLVRSHGSHLAKVEKLSRDLAQRTDEAHSIAADLNTAQSVAHIGSWVYDFVTDKITMSAETCRICGVPEGTQGRRFRYLKRVHPDDRRQLNRDWAGALKGQALVNEHRIRVNDAIRWIRQRAEVEFDPQGKPLRCVGTTQDITEIKLAEDEIRIAATAFESQEGMVVTDAGKRILRINQAFTHITGYSPDDVAGQTPSLLKSGRHDDMFYDAMWERINNNGSWQGEIWNRRKNGEVYPEWLTITAVKNGAGAVTHYVGTLTDITQRKATEDEIRHLAFYDPLTLLPNRRLLLDRLQQALASSARSKRQGALLFLDLDNFKDLNDSLGHDAGDVLLQQVALRLSSCIREGDTVSRIGGDEFVVMLVDLSTILDETAVQAETVGEKILATLGQPYNLNGHTHHSTASIGITLFSDHQSTHFELLKQADLAMYEAKAAGRNTIRLYTPEMRFSTATRPRDETAGAP
jgi:diguanylate cyclase (GGDEF)-like protein/PAS domain S-box-containing protein